MAWRETYAVALSEFMDQKIHRQGSELGAAKAQLAARDEDPIQSAKSEWQASLTTMPAQHVDARGMDTEPASLAW